MQIYLKGVIIFKFNSQYQLKILFFYYKMDTDQCNIFFFNFIIKKTHLLEMLVVYGDT